VVVAVVVAGMRVGRRGIRPISVMTCIVYRVKCIDAGLAVRGAARPRTLSPCLPRVLRPTWDEHDDRPPSFDR